MTRIFFPAMLLFCLTAAAAPGKITADRVNIRNSASTRGAVIARFNKGTIVEVTAKTSDGWVELAIREAYILKKFIRDGKVIDTVNFRSGPDTHCPRYGVFQKNTPVKVLESHGAWQKIALETPIKGYVVERFVSGDIADLPVAKPEKAPAPQTVQQTEKKAAAPKDNPRNFGNLPVDLKSGRDVTVSGLLYPVQEKDLPMVRYALLEVHQGKYRIACFVYTGTSRTYDAYANKNVKLIGDWYKVAGWDTPLMKVRKLKEE